MGTARTSLLCVCLVLAAPAFAETYDIVLSGGRVMDPETGVDAVRNVGITRGQVARISPQALAGRRVIDVRGLVVAPGFIDLHEHGQDAASGRLKAFDGVTTALEMEIGVPDVAAFLQKKEGRSLINYGTTASHLAARALVFGQPIHDPTILPQSGPATNQPATAEQIERIQERLGRELDAGARTVADRSTYAAPRETSIGMKYVIVNGNVLIDQGKLLAETFPGKALQTR